jgi:prepilin-type N-terminal cleavage/methylation domain-containing protein
MSKKAFSLIELSIVILVIAIIIAGVTQSSMLLEKAKLQSIRTLTLNSPVSGIADLLFWFETTTHESFITQNGTDQAIDNTQISQWNDISPQSATRYYLISSLGGIPTYIKKSPINNLPSIYCDFVNFNLSNSQNPNDCCAEISASNFTIFAVYMIMNGDNPLFFNGNNWQLSPYGTNPSASFTGSGFGDLVSDFYTTNHPEIISATSDKSSNFNLYVNGINNLSGTSTQFASGNFSISGTLFYISEFIFFSRALKAEERQAVEKYLGEKYAIKMAQ